MRATPPTKEAASQLRVLLVRWVVRPEMAVFLSILGVSRRNPWNVM
jgi:hypothetical protein